MARTAGLVARRVRQTVGGFSNGVGVLGAIARHSVTGSPAEIEYRTKDGIALVIPNEAGARVPVYEILVEDEYRLDWLTAGLRADAVVLDIGAHVGCFSVAAAHRLPGARVDSYEASPTTSGFLTRNIALNGLGDRVHGNNLAVRAAAGELEIADYGAASGHNGVLHLDEADVPRVTVPAVSMRDALHVSGRSADVVKIDTEGGEYDMVLGSDPADWSGVRRVVLEYHDLPGHSWDELEAFFVSAGLQVAERKPYSDGLGLAWLSRDGEAGPAPRG
jgi:FkbM family methyltransferase